MPHVFYPENIVDGCQPEGWFTSTPYGPVDILPIEANNDVMQQYDLMIFLGWNTFDNTDFIRIHKFVEKGGTLLLTAAHLNCELQPDKPALFPEDDTVVKKLLGLDYKSYTTRTEIQIGKGKVIYYPHNGYPIEDTIKDMYINDMKQLASQTIYQEPEKGWIKTSPFIDFAAWESEELRTIYVLNVDWDSNTPAQPATFVLKNKEFPLNIERYKLATIRCASGIAATALGNTSDILSITEEADRWIVTCQATEKDEVILMNGFTGEKKIETLGSAGIYKLIVNK